MLKNVKGTQLNSRIEQRPLCFVRVGGMVKVDLPELNTRGPARVVAIEPAPAIESGAGTVVTGRFRHLANAACLLDVFVEGLNEPIGCTELHPFWSVTRGTFVAARELRTGERLLTSGGTAAQIVSVHFRDSAEPVYNLEVLGPHVYRVSQLGLLVHNASWNNVSDTVSELSIGKRDARDLLNQSLGGIVGDGRAAHHLIPLDAISNNRTKAIIEAAARGGFSLNGSNNGVLLSQLFHRGGHSKLIERTMRQIERIGALSLSDLDSAKALQGLADSQRSFLRHIETQRLSALAAGTRGRIYIK